MIYFISVVVFTIVVVGVNFISKFSTEYRKKYIVDTVNGFKEFDTFEEADKYYHSKKKVSSSNVSPPELVNYKVLRFVKELV